MTADFASLASVTPACVRNLLESRGCPAKHVEFVQTVISAGVEFVALDVGGAEVAHGVLAIETRLDGDRITAFADAIVSTPEAFQRIEAIVELPRRLDDDTERTPLAGESTAVVAVVTEHGVLGAGCGDSGARLVEAVGFDGLTAD